MGLFDVSESCLRSPLRVQIPVHNLEEEAELVIDV